jgi:tetratricopeptide (TPR) repeat protein
MLVVVLSLAAASFAQDEDEKASPSAEAIELFQKGQDAHEKGQYATALELYEKAIALISEFPEAEYQRASALISLGRSNEAEKAFRRAVELRPEWTLALANLGSLLVGKREYVEAEKFLLKAISLDDQNTLAYSALTELRLQTNAKPDDLKDLLTRLTVLTERAKPTAAAWAARSALETALGDKVSARRSLDRALGLDPNNQFALTSKAGFALDEGDTKGADVIIRALESRYPSEPRVKILRARFLYASGKAEAAISGLESIENPPAEVVELRDRIKVSLNENPPALEQQLEKNPADAYILGRLCSLYRASNPAKALAMCRRASEAEPGNVNHAIGFAAALVQAKMYVEAVELLRRIVPLSPENVTVRANLATALFQLKRYPEAKAEYQWITEKEPDSPAAYYFLGITHDQLAEYLDAMANYQLFLRHADPEKNKVEIEKVNLRLPVLQKQIKEKKGKKS